MTGWRKRTVMEMAREAGIRDCTCNGVFGCLERFAKLVREDEREACAQVCESMRPSEREFDQRFFTACTLNANAIRERNNHD
jgi:hypothetical protein